jgi:hypothetical protein
MSTAMLTMEIADPTPQSEHQYTNGGRFTSEGECALPTLEVTEIR